MHKQMLCLQKFPYRIIYHYYCHHRPFLEIKDALSCKDDWVIHCATCVKCQKPDVGSTFTDFYTRWSNHKSHINKSRKTCTLAKYFIEKQCGSHNLKVTLVEKVKAETENYLEKCEGHWQRQLLTMHPHGFNIRKEFENGTRKSFSLLAFC